MFRRICKTRLPAMLLALAASAACAQATTTITTTALPATTLLKQTFDAAWARQPEARSHAMRHQAASARREISESWTAEPPSLELAGKTDQLNGNAGSREYEVGIAVPLWLPGERASTAALADAEVRASASRTLAAQLRTAAAVRTAYWDLQRARSARALATARLTNTHALAADVGRRVRAGDLARADQHQADGALAIAQAAMAEADGALATAAQRLSALSGAVPDFGAASDAGAEPEPTGNLDPALLERDHPALTELVERAEVARRAVKLAGVQGRANPELSLATARERGAAGESWQQTVTVGLRVPFGADARNRARVDSANAEAIEAEAQLGLERQRVLAEFAAARSQLQAHRDQLAAAQRRAQLGAEAREFFHKSFRLGETELPTLLRIELEAIDAERQLARSRIELGAAVSALRQAMGLLPE